MRGGRDGFAGDGVYRRRVRLRQTQMQTADRRHPAGAVHDLIRVRQQRRERVFDPTRVLQHLRLEHVRLRELELGGLRVFALRDERRFVDGAFEPRHGLQSPRVLAGVVLRDDDGHPVHARRGPLLEDLIPRAHELVDFPELDLHVRQVAQDLQVALVDLQRLAVTLDRLFVVTIDAVQKAVDVPADVAPDVVLQTKLHALVCLLALALPLHVPEDQALHRERLAVVRELLQDGVRRLEAFLEGLRFVGPHHLLEQRVLLRGKRHGTVRHRGGTTHEARRVPSANATRVRLSATRVGLSRIGSRRLFSRFRKMLHFRMTPARRIFRCRHRVTPDVADTDDLEVARGVFA